MLPAWLTLALYALATARVTGLVTADAITAPARKWAVERLDPFPNARPAKGVRGHAVYLLTCPWCVSIYVGALAAIVWYTVGNHPVPVVLAALLAFSQTTGMISNVGRG